MTNQVFFKRGEMSASLKLVGKVAWENDRFVRWEMRREIHMTSEEKLGYSRAEDDLLDIE